MIKINGWFSVRGEVAFRLATYLLGLYLGWHDGVVDYVWSVDGVDRRHPVRKGELVKSNALTREAHCLESGSLKYKCSREGEMCEPPQG